MNYCACAANSPLDREYHDNEWGVPCFNNNKLLEYLSLELLQCGLSWRTILQKRPTIVQCFEGFDLDTVASYGSHDVQRIMQTPHMIHSKRKIEAIIHNAQCITKVAETYGSFSAYLWHFTQYKSVVFTAHHTEVGFPSHNALSETVSKGLKAMGLRYMGAVTTYSLLQACGIINDHHPHCPRYKLLIAAAEPHFY